MNATCPICKKEFVSDSRQGPFPFCSWRCKKVDLYNWLHEEYRYSEPLADESSNEFTVGHDIPNRGAAN